jgi:hypothetical protein
MSKTIKSLGDLTLDKRNANKGTPAGQDMVDQSIADYGAGRSIVVDRNGAVIGGNKTLKSAIDAGLDVEVVTTKGDKLIVHQREDLDLDEDTKARMLAYADNRASELGLVWDADILTEDIENGLDLGDMFGLGDVLSITMVNESTGDEEWIGMPEFDAQETQPKIVITFQNDIDREKFIIEFPLQIRKKQAKTWSTVWPYKGYENLRSKKYTDD